MDLPPITPTAVGVGLAVAVVGYALGRLVGSGVTWALTRGGRSPSAARVFGSLVAGGLTVLALGAAVTVVFPSVKPVDVFGGIGVISIAAGIAFQTVLGNMFAGMVILARDRFRVGDQIAVADHAGTVVEMGLSATGIKTFDGRLVLVPNAVMHSEVVTVQTGFERVRSTVRVDVDDAVALLTDPAERAHVAHLGDARHQRREQQRDDQHEDQVEEDRGERRGHVARDRLHPLRIRAGQIGQEPGHEAGDEADEHLPVQREPATWCWRCC